MGHGARILISSKRKPNLYFKRLFVSNESCAPNSLQLSNICPLSVEMVNALVGTMTTEEVKKAMFCMSP